MNIFSYRVRFTKTGRMRFLSHHDLMRLWERALRRTGLPLRFTEGYNPHPILAFPTALALGIESFDEVFEFELTGWTAPRQIERLLAAQLPEGMSVLSVEAFDRKDRSYVDFVEYEALCPGQGGRVPDAIRAFLARAECPVERVSDKGSRTIDIRPYVMALDSEGDRVFLRLRVTDQGTARPDEVLRALGLSLDETVRIKKTYTELAVRP
ncbi:MAG TPA: TIGR03936 family radical SAM-associated protein [Planctomycetota bacterium]|nr:TIGR03936 family radical SAM-associated protein [Planctomycetota bacterium]